MDKDVINSSFISDFLQKLFRLISSICNEQNVEIKLLVSVGITCLSFNTKYLNKDMRRSDFDYSVLLIGIAT